MHKDLFGRSIDLYDLIVWPTGGSKVSVSMHVGIIVKINPKTVNCLERRKFNKKITYEELNVRNLDRVTKINDPSVKKQYLDLLHEANNKLHGK